MWYNISACSGDVDGFDLCDVFTAADKHKRIVFSVDYLNLMKRLDCVKQKAL